MGSWCLTMFLGLDSRKCWATCAGSRLKRILLLSSLTFSMPSRSSSAYWDTHICTHTQTSPTVLIFKGCISDFLGRNINDYINLIFPHDPLTARLIRPSKKHVSVGVFLTSCLWGGQLADRLYNLSPHEVSKGLHFTTMFSCTIGLVQ